MSEVRGAAHPLAWELVAYVQGELAGGDAEALETHVAACDACGASLAREARVEVAFHHVAARASASARRSSARSARFAAGGAIAAAALLFVWLARGAGPSADAMSDAGPLPGAAGDAASLVDGG